MIGTGYVGLVSGTCFAEKGFTVTCVDLDTPKFKALKEQGIIPIHEPGLEELVKKNVAAGRLKFTTRYEEAIPQADAVFIAVGTPQDEDGSADLSHVEAAAKQIAPHLQGYTLIINKSTVPVGTGARVEAIMRAANPAAQFDVASNPEFLREGEAIEDFMQPDRIVAGVENDRAWAMVEGLYKPFTDEGYPLFITNRASSELIKYAANAFLATKITFINELIALCEAAGADVLAVSKGMGMDARIAPRFLNPGPGYGGSCFPKDTNALAKTARDHGLKLRLVEETIATNEAIKQAMVGKITQALGGTVSGKTLGVLGLAFKANTDDMRDASALTILPELVNNGAKIQAFDPAAMPRAKQLMPQLSYADSAMGAVRGADAVVILTEWNEFRTLDLAAAKIVMRGSMLVDLRNLFDARTAAEAGLQYVGLGR
ncbi:MAG: UDP-glucose/GDP-mannose dehydrogenase family protein [Alphaproteobacteria bacterium]|nr:UDP-glucose/GDP-mannose dehydrogenase family protein [Alphaproteobacteria bacterium]